MLFLQLDKLFDVSSFGLAFADHFIFINVQKVNFPNVGAYYQSIAFSLVG